MNTSVQVMFFVSVGVVSIVYAFYLDVRREAEHDRFLQWLKTERQVDWEALTRSDRFLAIRAVEILRRGPLVDDAEFLARYQQSRHGNRFFLALTVAVVCIATVIIGTVLLDWAW